MADENDDTGGAGGESDADKAVKALAAKNAELLEELKKTRAKAREFEAAEAQREKDKLDAEDAAARKAKDFDTIETGYKTKLSKAEAEALTFKAKYESLIIDRGLDEALTAAKVNPALAKAAHALIKAEHGVELSEDGKATIGGKALADFVAEWSKSDTGKAFVTSGNSGGGSSGSGNGGGGGNDKNPFKAGSINLTEQGRLLRADPARAKQLAAEAGVKL